MPFAVVNGEPFTQMPRICTSAQAPGVYSPGLRGPLDLCCTDPASNLNILDIPLAENHAPVMKTSKVRRSCSSSWAGEYMVMAAPGRDQIAMLLPRPG